MPERYKKRCSKCGEIFEGGGTGNCPKCGSGTWRFLNEKPDPESIEKLTFTVRGNQSDLKGNPIPYLRMTQNEVKLLRIPDHRIRSDEVLKKKMGIRRYLDWKNYVKQCCYFTSKIGSRIATTEEVRVFLQTGGKLQLDCMIYFANKKHGDADNIFKGVADALFKSDKHIVGSVDYQYDADNPRVEVTITRR